MKRREPQKSVKLAAEDKPQAKLTTKINAQHRGRSTRRQYAESQTSPGTVAALFVALLAGLAYLAPDFTQTVEQRKTADMKEKEDRKRAFTKYRQTLDRMMEVKYEEEARKEACDIFLGTTSIPNSGSGFFAGRDYAEGETVLIEEWKEALSIKLSNDATLHLPSFAFLLKSHPVLQNLKGTMYKDKAALDGETFVLTASKAITAGTELFVPHYLHPLSAAVAIDEKSMTPHSRTKLKTSDIFPFIPSDHDYRLVDEILNDVVLAKKRMETSDKRKGNPISAGYLFNLLHRTVSKFNSDLASLLPISLQDYDRWYEKQSRNSRVTVSTAVLRQPSMAALQFHAHCWSDMKATVSESSLGQSSKEDDSTIVVASRSLEAGQKLTRIPVHVTTKDLARKLEGHCLTRGDMAICPLTHTASFLTQKTNAGDESNVNVELVWTDPRKIDSISFYEAQRVASGGALRLEWDVVAKQDLEQGTKLILRDPSGYLVPDHWRV